MRTTPPAWAEAILRLFLRPDIFISVSGDLLEQYRDSILPSRGPSRADNWYVVQVLGLTLRKVWLWAVLFAGTFVSRFALDALQPTTDFHLRSQVTGYTAIGLLLTAGFWTARQSGSFVAGAVTGFATIAIAGALTVAGNTVFLAFWHDASTMRAISASGGLDEAFLLPIIMIVPGTILAAFGGFIGAGTSRLLKATK